MKVHFSLTVQSLKKINKQSDKARRLSQKIFSDEEKKGNNQDVFYYQIIKVAPTREVVFRLCFYGDIIFIIIAKEQLQTQLTQLTYSIKQVYQPLIFCYNQ